ncbi:Pol polyprotein [Cucumis melo var. makuwa]|uniref:Pol polyprotein n=1 Tax=Cucumis melo var. makuwa TaxID=1194695 RepID=A0A5D3DZ58_CUCMM|nr:Pol polyprotein [Cucumis melo var. makuwa]
MVNSSCKDWADHMDSTLWAYCTTSRTPIGMSPYALVFGKVCHLPLEQHKALWACKKLNFDKHASIEVGLLQLHKLQDWCS